MADGRHVRAGFVETTRERRRTTARCATLSEAAVLIRGTHLQCFLLVVNRFVWTAAIAGTLVAPLLASAASVYATGLASWLAWLGAGALSAWTALRLARPARGPALGAAAALAVLLVQDAPVADMLQTLVLCMPAAALTSAIVLVALACRVRATPCPGVRTPANAQSSPAREREAPVYARPQQRPSSDATRAAEEGTPHRALPGGGAQRFADADKLLRSSARGPVYVPPEIRRAFAVFGFAQPVSPEAVRRAWRQRVSAAHPDRHAGADALRRQRAHAETVRLNAALQCVLRWYSQS